MNKKINLNCRYLYFCIFFIFTLIEYLIFIYSLGGYGPSKIATTIKCAGDLALIFAIYWILPTKRIWIINIIQLLLSIFFLANIWNYHFFKSLLSPLSYRLVSNLNGTLISSLSNALSFTNCILLLFPLVLVIIYKYMRRHYLNSQWEISNKNKILAIACSFFMWGMAQCAFMVTEIKQDCAAWGFPRESIADNLKCRFSFNIDDRSPNLGQLRLEGLILYFGRSLVMVCQDIATNGGKINLTEEEITHIDEYITKINIHNHIDKNQLSVTNSHKNLIIILVESLNSYVINKFINGHALTPVMNNLIQSNGSIVSLNVRTQVNLGISNDGQLIINTGLLPIDKGVVMMNFGSTNTFPSLTKALPEHDNLVIFGDNGQTWNQTQSFKNFGFNSIYSELDFSEQADSIGNDAAMFNLCKQIIPSLKFPFLIELVSFSTHVPFHDKGVKNKAWIHELKDTEEHVKSYYNMVNYFDRELGKFISYLKHKKLWDNTILIITSDHSILHALSHDKRDKYSHLADIPAVFIATNTGISKNIQHPIGQVNIYPTILQIMNSNGINGYTGLGRSMLDSCLQSAIDYEGRVYGISDSIELKNQKLAFEISSLINKGNYFGIKRKKQ